MERRWRTRRNHAGVTVSALVCFRGRRSCTRNSGNRFKPGCASVAGKSRVSARTSERHHQRRERQGTTWPVAVRFGRSPNGSGISKGRARRTRRWLPRIRHNASRRDPARYETLRARLGREVPAGPQESFMPTRPDSSCRCWLPSRTLLMPSARANAWASPRERSAT